MRTRPTHAALLALALLAAATARGAVVRLDGPRTLPGSPVPHAPLVELFKGPPAPSGPSSPAAARALAGLSTEGYAVFPAGALMGEETRRGILEAADRHDYWRSAGEEKVWPLLRSGGRLRDLAGIRGFIESITSRLGEAMPGEPLALDTADLRLIDGAEAQAWKPHADGGYVTVTYALRGPGTWVYQVRGRQVEERRVPPGTVVVTSNEEREVATGILATLHSAPLGILHDRVLLLLRYGREGYKATEAELEKVWKARISPDIKKIREFRLRQKPG